MRRLTLLVLFSLTLIETSGEGQVVLSWSTSGSSYFVVSPQIGAPRGNGVTATPAQTTTYALDATERVRAHKDRDGQRAITSDNKLLIGADFCLLGLWLTS